LGWTASSGSTQRNAQALFKSCCANHGGQWCLNQVLVGQLDPWKTIPEYAPNLIQIIPKRVVKQRTVAQALQNRRWVSDIKGALTVQVLVEYLQIWDLVDDFNLHQDIPIIISGGLEGLVLIEQLSLRGVFYWDHHFCTLEAGFEILGPSQLQILNLVGN